MSPKAMCHPFLDRELVAVSSRNWAVVIEGLAANTEQPVGSRGPISFTAASQLVSREKTRILLGCCVSVARRRYLVSAVQNEVAFPRPLKTFKIP